MRTWIYLIVPFSLSCAPMQGGASLSFLAERHPVRTELIPVADVVEREACWRWFAVFFATGSAPAHEPLITGILEEFHADYLLDAELETSGGGFPYIYVWTCATVRGRPAKLRAGGET